MIEITQHELFLIREALDFMASQRRRKDLRELSNKLKVLEKKENSIK